MVLKKVTMKKKVTTKRQTRWPEVDQDIELAGLVPVETHP